MMKESFSSGLQPRVLRMLPEPTTGTGGGGGTENVVVVVEEDVPAAMTFRLFMMSSTIRRLSSSCTPSADDRPKFITRSSSLRSLVSPRISDPAVPPPFFSYASQYKPMDRFGPFGSSLSSLNPNQEFSAM